MKSILAIISAVLIVSGSEALCPMGHGQHSSQDIFKPQVADSSTGTASQKMNDVRTKVAATAGKPGPWPAALDMAKIFMEDMGITEDLVSDEFHNRGFGTRKKLIHSSGAIAETRIEWKPNPYTGLFQSAEHGFIRMSSAIQPDYTKTNSEEGSFTPGMGMKFFRDNHPSGNIMTLASLMPRDSYNFFKYPQSNHLPTHDMPTAQNLLAAKFRSAPSEWEGFIGLNSFARYTEDGKAVPDSELHFPFQLIMYPNEDLQQRFPDSGAGRDLFSTQLKGLPAGQHLYSVYAKDTRTAPQQHIGDIYMTTEFIESSYADEMMFLQHTRFDDDMKLRPDFLDGCTGILDCAVCPQDEPCQ